MTKLLLAREVDRLFIWPRGRAARLAAQAKIPHLRLPDGSIRFRADEIEKIVAAGATKSEGGGTDAQ